MWRENHLHQNGYDVTDVEEWKQMIHSLRCKLEHNGLLWPPDMNLIINVHP
jgi:hypothetical protein